MEVVLVHGELEVDPLGVLSILQQIAENTADVDRTVSGKGVPCIECSESPKDCGRVDVYRGRKLRSVLRTA